MQNNSIPKLAPVEIHQLKINGSGEDLDMKEQNEMLHKLNSELDNFVYHVSHDIRAPLSSILGLVNLAKLSDDPTDLKKYIVMMEERAKALDKFIHDVLDYSRNSRNQVVNSEFAFDALLTEILEGLSYMENVSKVKIDVNMNCDPVIIADRHRVKVVLGNLISNAIKYYNPAEENPFVKISLADEGLNYKITVEDNGRGIDEEYLPKIYDMFFRATDASSGSGIGLYIVKEVLAKLRGTIEVTSQFSVGTIFTVRLDKAKN